eukprot:gene32438-42026_t
MFIPKRVVRDQDGRFSTTAAVIPTSVTYLGDKAFLGTKIDIVVLPTSLSSIGKRAFQNCEILSLVVLPTTIVQIGKGAFYGCGSLGNITLPPFLTKIESLVFQGCTKLKTIFVSAALQSIGNNSFRGCSSLQQLPNLTAVTTIGTSAFQGCSSLTQVTLSAAVKSIGDKSFADCTQLKEVFIPNSNTALAAITSATFSGCYNLEMATLSFSIKTISSSAFKGCSALTTVVMPNVTAIQPQAFDGDLNLNCLISQNQFFVTNLVRSSCTSTCAPLSGCPVQLHYTFSENSVSGSMVANFANNFKDFDAELQNGATVSHNQLVLAADKQQFMKIHKFSSHTSEFTVTFWFNALTVPRGTVCQFSDESFLDKLRVYLSSGRVNFRSGTFVHGILGFVAKTNKWYHVAWVQAIQSSDDNTFGCDWSFFVNGKAFETIRGSCALYGSMSLNYFGKSSVDPGAYFNGSIKDFRLYNSALKSNEIELIFGSTNPTLSPTMAPTALPIMIPTVAPSTLVLWTTIDGVASPLSDGAIAGIVIATLATIIAFLIGIYFYLRPKVSFMDKLMNDKQEEFKKFSSSSPTGSIGAPPYRPSDANYDSLMGKLNALLDAGEKWRKCYHSETEHGEQCFVELWRSPLNDTVALMCTDCASYKAITAETMPEKFEYERRRMDEDREKYDFEPRNSANRGLTVGFLVEFCRNFDLWKVPTGRVRRDYIIPMTKDFRCRFVDLPVMQESDIVGLADIFISFSNATLFGDLIAAISDGADYRRRVWIDIFAVMQWPSAKSDLHFDKVIRRCPKFLSICPSVEAVGKQINISGVSELSKEDKKMIPYFRVWCLYEIFHAAILKKEQDKERQLISLRPISMGSTKLIGDGLNNVYKSTDIESKGSEGLPHPIRTILFKTGSCEFNPDGSHFFKVDKKMLSDLIKYIDINNADATSEDDKKWIFNQIETRYSSNGGVAKLNNLVIGVLTTAKILDSDPILECAVRGKSLAEEAIHSRPELYILNAVRGGLTDLLRRMMKVNDESMVEVSIYNRLDVAVKVYLIKYDDASLNYKVNIEKHKNATHLIAEGSFWIAREDLNDNDVGVYIATAAKKKWTIY